MTTGGVLTLLGTHLESFVVTLGTYTGDTNEFVNFTAGTTLSFDIAITSDNNGTPLTKRYVMPVGQKSADGWLRCAPISVYNQATDDHELQLYSAGGVSPSTQYTLKLRLVRTVGTPPDPEVTAPVTYLTVDIIAHHAQDNQFSVSSIDVSDNDVSWNTYGFVPSTALTQVGSQVGVGTMTPSYKLDVAGTLRSMGAATVAGLTTSGAIAPSADNTYTLGSTTNKWSTVYAKSYNGLPRKYWSKYNLGLINTSTGYQKIATMQAFVGANNSVLRISGQFGGEASFAVIDMYVSTRPSPPISVTGTAHGKISAAKAYGDIVVYLESDSTYSVYISTTKQFGSWDLSVEGNSGNVLLEPSSTNTTAPTGTLQTPSSLGQLAVTTETATGVTTFSGSVTCTGLTSTSGLNITSTSTGNILNMSTAFAPINTGNIILSDIGTALSANNCAYVGFANAGGAGSSNNYAAFGLYGNTMGTGTINASGNGKFGVCTTTPAATLDVSGTGKYSGALTCGSTITASSNLTTAGRFSIGSVAGTPTATGAPYLVSTAFDAVGTSHSIGLPPGA
jgi:hypothetical protein